MTVNSRQVNLRDAPALRGTTADLQVAVLQPCGNLVMDETRGPHYIDSTLACKMLDEFLRVVRENQSLIAIVPEYFVPNNKLLEMMRSPECFRNETIYILPVETTHYETYIHNLELLVEIGNWTIEAAAFQDVELNPLSWVNMAAIVFCIGGNRRVFIQPKTCPAGPERGHMLLGREIFGFEGEHGVLCTAICADVNDDRSRSVWQEIAAWKRFAVVVHCQFNRKPDFETIYSSFWSSILNAENGENSLVISANWAKGSSIGLPDGGTVQIDRQSNRYARGKPYKNKNIYRTRSNSGLHLQQSTQSQNPKKKWEVWHCLSDTSNIRLINFVRPIQDVIPAETNKAKGVNRSTLYRFNVSYDAIESSTGFDLSTFITKLQSNCNIGTNVAILLNGLSPCEIEIFAASCEMLEEGSWLKHDADSRIPTSYMLCIRSGETCTNGTPCPHYGKSCSQNRETWSDAILTFASSLDALNNFKAAVATNLIPCFEIGYPINLRDIDTQKTYWLLHGKGRAGRFVGKSIAARLSQSRLCRQVKQINILVAGVDGNITKTDVVNTVQTDATAISSEYTRDIFEDEHLPNIDIHIINP